MITALCIAAVPADTQEPRSLRLRDAFSGSLDLGFDLAANDRDHDLELHQILRLTADPPSRPQLRFVSSFWLIEDLDGTDSPTSSFRTLTDTRSEAVDPRLLTLYLERQSNSGQSIVRAGRQRIEEGIVWNAVDGIYFRVTRPVWSWYGFGGSRASIYDYSLHEWVGGGGASVRLPTRTHARLDLFFGEEAEAQGLLDEAGSILTSLSVTQALGLRHYADARATWHESDLDEFWISARGVFKKPELVYSVTYRSKQSVRSNRLIEISDFFQVLGELNDYQDLSASIAIPVTQHFSVGLQGQFHDAEQDAVTTSNRDFDRYGITLDFTDLAGKYDISLAADRWDTDDGEHQETLTGSITRKWARSRLSAGMDFDQFQDRILLVDPVFLTPIQVDSSEDIYTWFLELRHDIDENRGLRVRLSLEDDDGPDSPYTWLRASYTMRF